MASVMIFQMIEGNISPTTGKWDVVIDQARPGVAFDLASIIPWTEESDHQDAELVAETDAAFDLTFGTTDADGAVYAPGMSATDLRNLYLDDALFLLVIADYEQPFKHFAFSYLLLNAASTEDGGQMTLKDELPTFPVKQNTVNLNGTTERQGFWRLVLGP